MGDKIVEVKVPQIAPLYEYKRITQQSDFQLLLQLASRFRTKKLVFISSTSKGGGVSIMRRALISLYKSLYVDAHWYVLKPDPEVFKITKRKFHNVLQAVTSEKGQLTEKDIKSYNAWIQENAKLLKNPITNSDVIVIDDPQPSGLIPYIKKWNPQAKIIYRSHIQIVSKLANTSHTPQKKTWDFIWNNISSVDCFVAHPLKEFIPKNVPKNKIVFMPATTDPLDSLNKKLTHIQMDHYIDSFNKPLIQSGQAPLNTKKPYIIQIARFDPSKGIPDVIESYRILCMMLSKRPTLIPQLVICGNTSIDDPEGKPLYDNTMRILNSPQYSAIASNVKIALLPPIDELLNTLLRKSYVALQLSTKEGFEIKVTESLLKGKPVVAYKTGGIPLQVRDHVNGYLVEAGNTKKVATYLYKLITNKDLYSQMSNAAEELANTQYLTIPNAICWLYLANTLVTKGVIVGNYSWVKHLADKEL